MYCTILYSQKDARPREEPADLDWTLKTRFEEHLLTVTVRRNGGQGEDGPDEYKSWTDGLAGNTRKIQEKRLERSLAAKTRSSETKVSLQVYREQ